MSIILQSNNWKDFNDSLLELNKKEKGNALTLHAGISKNVTFHIGRHTFGTLMATKIPLPTLQNLMQHSDIKTTMIYVNMSKQMIDDSLDKVDWNN